MCLLWNAVATIIVANEQRIIGSLAGIKKPIPIADEANMVTIEALADNFNRFHIGILHEWEATPGNVDNLSHEARSNIFHPKGY